MTAALVAVFGSEPLINGAEEADRSLRPLLRALTGLPAWAVVGDGVGVPGWALAAKLATLLVAVVVLTRIVATAGSRTAAFLAGWAAVVLSSALAAVMSVQVSALLLAGPTEPANGIPATVQATNTGATFGLYTGWLVGLTLAATIVPVRRPAVRKSPTRKTSPRPRATGPTPTPTPPPTTWPPRPRIGTALPNPAWTAAGLHQEPTYRPKAEASGVSGVSER